MGGRGKGGQGVKRKASFSHNHGGKRGNADSSNQWGSEPIAQQPLKQDESQWFQDTVDAQWG